VHRTNPSIAPGALVKPDYLGSPAGSSVEELVRAANAVGVRADPVDHLNISGLRFLTQPTLLLVKREPNSRRPDHWVLFLGERAGTARVVDPAVGPQSLALADLAGRWDGIGIVLGRESNALIAPESLASMFQWASLAGLLVAATYLAHAVGLRVATLESSMARHRIAVEAGLLASLVSSTAIVGQWISPDSLLHQPAAAEAVRREGLGSLLPKVALGNLAAALAAPSARLIDARYAEDAAQGMIPGATNLPPDMDAAAFAARIGAWDRRAPVVVYCLSPACPFSARVAARLQDAGFTDIRLFPGGWQEWAASRTASVGDGIARGPATRRRAP
jgi:rhodanese-related sulfurtransferase